MIPIKERLVIEVMRVMEDTSSSKVRQPANFCMKWLDHEKSDENRKKNVILTVSVMNGVITKMRRWRKLN